MISNEDKNIIVRLADKYNITRVILFGSSALPEIDGHDIDLAVEGIDPAEFFNFYSDLIFKVSKPVDLVDLTGKSRFNDMIASEGLLLYG